MASLINNTNALPLQVKVIIYKLMQIIATQMITHHFITNFISIRKSFKRADI